jgi:hypothetical protein
MQDLIERYLIAALERVPASKRAEIDREIRVVIDEMVDLRIAAGEPEDSAVRGALSELGEPAKLGASYTDEKRYLIGPGWYPLYIMMLKRLAPIGLGLAVAIGIFLDLGTSDVSTGDLIENAVETFFTIGLKILFWVTLAFAIAERTMDPNSLETGRSPWKVDDLPKLPARRQITLGDALGTIITMVIVAVLVAVQHINGFGGAIDNDEATRDMPLLNPDLAPAWAVPFFGLVAFSIGVAIYGYLRRTWNRPVFLANVLDAVLWIVFAVVLAAAEPMFNVELVQRLDWGDDIWGAGEQANLTLAAIVIAISLWDLWEAWRGHARYRSDNS